MFDVAQRWTRVEKLDARPSQVTLHLVPCAPGDLPSEAQVQGATKLLPCQTLREAGVLNGSFLRADVDRGGAGAP